MLVVSCPPSPRTCKACFPLPGEMKTNIVTYLVRNKRRIAKALYLAAALIEHLPDGDGFAVAHAHRRK
jgi:hypothetical protein